MLIQHALLVCTVQIIHVTVTHLINVIVGYGLHLVVPELSQCLVIWSTGLECQPKAVIQSFVCQSDMCCTWT